MATRDWLEKIEQLNKMLHPDFNFADLYEEQWEVEENIIAIVKNLYKQKDINNCCEFYQCGASSINNTPVSLYRILYLINPTGIDFNDMYKSALFYVISPCSKFLIQFYLFKYELAVYFYCTKEHLCSETIYFWGGAPDADNKVSCTSDIGNLWFDTIVQVINRKYNIYPGNDFVV